MGEVNQQVWVIPTCAFIDKGNLRLALSIAMHKKVKSNGIIPNKAVFIRYVKGE